MACVDDERKPTTCTICHSDVYSFEKVLSRDCLIFDTLIDGRLKVVSLELMAKPRKVILCIGVRGDFCSWMTNPRDSWRRTAVCRCSSSFLEHWSIRRTSSR